MWIPFYNRQSGDTVDVKVIESELPEDLKSYLSDHEPTISEREFRRTLQSSSNRSKLAPAPSVEDIIEKPTPEELLNNMSAFNKLAQQPVEKLSSQDLEERREVEEYKRKNPITDAVLENCSEIQKEFFDCLTSGSTQERLSGCNDKQNFHESCLRKQLMIFRMFDYESMEKIREFDEVRGTADVVFNKYYKNYHDTDDESKNKLFGKELRERREKFYQKHGK